MSAFETTTVRNNYLSSLVICIFNQADTGEKENSPQNQEDDSQPYAPGPTSGKAYRSKNKPDYP